MGLNLVNLDTQTRPLMLEEIDRDVKAQKLYISARLSATGARDYSDLLIAAARDHDDAWLAAEIRKPGRLNPTEQRKARSGFGVTIAKVPITAADTMAEGEFNRFYIRGVCRRAIADGQSTVTIYRAKSVMNPRLESVQLEGQSINAQALLDDLRIHTGIDTVLGLPPGPNSGLSARLI
jgi:hypothetical protein